MADRPIIFSAPMVRALLEGRKTQTRRLLPAAHPKFSQHSRIRTDVLTFDPHDPQVWYWDGTHDRVGASYMVPYAPGDRLYVREAIAKDSAPGSKVHYRADHSGDASGLGWRPSIHMPRWASRLTLTVTDVRVQRLQDISENDAKSEGAMFHDGGRTGHSGWRHDFSDVHASARSSFARLWNSLHGADAWDANPWVVAVSFTVAHGNIDQIGGGNG